MAGQDPDRNDTGSVLRSVGPLLGSGLQLALSVVVMFLIGRWLDGKFGTTPWLMVVGIAFGFAAGMVALIRTVNAMSRNNSGSGN
jgi:ATP synthase protein I